MAPTPSGISWRTMRARAGRQRDAFDARGHLEALLHVDRLAVAAPRNLAVAGAQPLHRPAARRRRSTTTGTGRPPSTAAASARRAPAWPATPSGVSGAGGDPGAVDGVAARRVRRLRTAHEQPLAIRKPFGRDERSDRRDADPNRVAGAGGIDHELRRRRDDRGGPLAVG